MDDKPRPKAPTLVGIGPPGAAVVVGAVGRPELSSNPAVETRRMLFEPGAGPEYDVEPVPPPLVGTPAAAPAPEPTPSPPPAPAEMVETPALPPVAPVAEPFELVRPAQTLRVHEPPPPPEAAATAQGRKSRKAIVAGVFVVVAALAVAVSLGQRAKKAGLPRSLTRSASQTATPTATPTATANPTATATVTATATATVTPTPTATPTPPAAFNSYAAHHAVDATSPEVARCRRGKAYGIAIATVTFANDGSVSEAIVSPPFAGTPTGACIVDGLVKAHVAPFIGKPGVITSKVYVGPK